MSVKRSRDDKRDDVDDDDEEKAHVDNVVHALKLGFCEPAKHPGLELVLQLAMDANERLLVVCRIGRRRHEALFYERQYW